MKDMKSIFIDWISSAFDANSWYTPTQDVLIYIREREEMWEEIENALIAWGVLGVDDSEEEMRAALENLSANDVDSIACLLRRIERKEEK